MGKIANIGAHFVSRIKKNTAYKVIENRGLKGYADNILADQIIELTNKNPKGGRKNLLAGKALRLIEVYDKEHEKHISLLVIYWKQKQRK